MKSVNSDERNSVGDAVKNNFEWDFHIADKSVVVTFSTINNCYIIVRHNLKIQQLACGACVIKIVGVLGFHYNEKSHNN